MSTVNNGGPAFPLSHVTVLAEDGTQNEAAGVAHDGMSLRDWFAGQVLAGYSATGFPDEGLDHVSLDDIAIARHCYALTGAMLAARQTLSAAAGDAETRLTAIVRAFIDKHRISCPETIHQTDRVIENAYGLIEDLADVVGYFQYPEDEA